MGIRAIMIIVFCICYSSVYAQDTITNNKKDIYIISRPLKDSIILRWAPSNYICWDYANKFGYKLIRYTILRDSILLERPEEKTLLDPAKIYAADDWKNIVEKDKYSAIAAQAIFGESFVIDPGEGFNPNQIRTKAMEQQQRFSFALYAADMSPKAAKAMALWYTDKEVNNNEKYLYRIIVNVPDTLNESFDTAFVFTGQADYMELPQPYEFKGDFADRMVTFSWNAFVHNSIYTGYFIERSGDKGKTYQAINKEPIAFMYSETAVHPEYMYRLDSLPENNKEYYFRIRGKTSFGELGPWTEPIKGKGTESITEFPIINKYETIKKGAVIYWEFPKEAEHKISGFKILRSNNDKSGFEVLSKKIKPGERQFMDKKPLGTNYYMVAAYKDTSYIKHSYPYLVQLTDSMPPDPPKGLAGNVDTAFVVHLSWEPNKEEDIFGYRVFRSVSGKDEYSQITHTPIFENKFHDTINKQDINASVFYKILAVDERQNESEFSEILKIGKPDIVPPSAPLFRNVKAIAGGVELSWINSSSEDVDHYLLKRKPISDTTWINVEKIAPKKKEQETTFVDNEATPGVVIKYRIYAIDGSNNESFDESIGIQAIKSRLKPGVTKIKSTIDDKSGNLILSWEKLEGVKWHRIYRKANEGQFVLYGTTEGEKNSYTDEYLKAGNNYFYCIKVIFKDGSVSGFSEEIEIKF